MTDRPAEGALVMTFAKPPARSPAGLFGELLDTVGLEAMPPLELGKSALARACSKPDRGTITAMRELAASRRFDVNWVRLDGGVRRLLIADMDSTIIGVECIDQMAIRAGAGEAVADITAAAMRGEVPFAESVAQRVALCRGMRVETLEEIWREEITLTAGAGVLARTMAERGAHTALISGGYTYFAERVAKVACFAEFRANILEIREGVLTGRVTPPILDRKDKARFLVERCRTLGCSPADAVAIGDGANDRSMIEQAGLGIAWRAKPVLREAADVVLDHSNLDAVLHLQGLHEDDFARVEAASVNCGGSGPQTVQ